MDAYVLGTLDGDLPTNVLGPQGRGNVRAMGRLEGGPHNVFVAVEADSRQGIDDALAAVDASGIAAAVSFRPDPDAAATIPNIIHWPSRMPPWERLIFIWLEAELAEEAVREAHNALGTQGVAIASHGGKSLVELGHAEPATAEAAADAFIAAHPGAVMSRVDAGGLSSTGKDG